MKHEVPNWLAEALAIIGAFILLITQAKRIWGWLRILGAWWQRRANAISDLAAHVGEVAHSLQEIVRVNEARFSHVENKVKELHCRAIVNHQQTMMMLDESPIPQWQCRLPEGACEWVNPACAELFRMESHDMLVWGWLSAIHADDLARTQNDFLETIRNGRPYKVRYRVMQDGQPLTVEATGRIIKNDDGTPLALIGKVIPVPVHL
jgi:PAS domain-containing protein